MMGSTIHELELNEGDGVAEDPGALPIAFLSRRSRTLSVIGAVRSRMISTHNPASVDGPEACRQAALLHAKEQVCEAITVEPTSTKLRARCVDWYTSYLEYQISAAWAGFSGVLRHQGGTQLVSCTPEALTQVFKILLQVITFLQMYDEEGNCTLDSLVSCLESESLIREDHDFHARQMVFGLIGWCSALYSPSDLFSDRKFSLKEDTRGAKRRRLLRNPAIRVTSIDPDNAKAPLCRLFSRFGSLLPEVECVRRTASVGGLEAGTECIISSYVSYQNLKHIQNIRIEWVDMLAQHLEFDQRNNILRIFRLPSICLLMYRGQGDTLISRLFKQHQKEAAADIPHGRNPHNFESSFEDFLVEVLLSYRLIFGRNSRSRTAISRLLSTLKTEWQNDCVSDPLLETLCTEDRNSPRINEIYNDLEATEFEDYISVDEFPFLGRRLVDLQRFSMGQNPHSLRRLWYDRRNIGTWFAIWAVVIFGGGALVVQIFQLAVQFWQTLQ